MWRPVERLMLNASYGFTDARFVEFSDGKEDYKGKFIPYSPKNTLFVGASYNIPVNRSSLDAIDVGVDMKGIGDIYWNEANSVKQPFYTLLSASLLLTKGDFSLKVWGDNLANTHYNSFYFVSIGNAFLQQGKPARCGVTLRMNFKSK